MIRQIASAPLLRSPSESVYEIRHYVAMIEDRTRTEAYAEALARAIRRDSVVVDIGTGSGTFGLLAARLGARRVFAIDPDDVIQLAGDLAAADGLADRIEFIQELSTAVELPERADVVVSESSRRLAALRRASSRDRRRSDAIPPRRRAAHSGDGNAEG